MVCVPSAANSTILIQLAALGVPALSQTPPAETVEDLSMLYELTTQGAKVQVAEQYLFQPVHQALLSVATSGKLGRVTHAQVAATEAVPPVARTRKLRAARRRARAGEYGLTWKCMVRRARESHNFPPGFCSFAQVPP